MNEEKEIQQMTLLDIFALQVLGSVLPIEYRTRIQSVEMAYEIAEEMMRVRQNYEITRQVETPKRIFAGGDDV